MKPRQPPLSGRCQLRPVSSAGKMRMENSMVASAARFLICRNSGTEAPLRAQHACYSCFGPLEISYDTDQLAQGTRAQIEPGPYNMWRFAPLFPGDQYPPSQDQHEHGPHPHVQADAQ